jgi:DNA replication and repair protein RecF
LLVRALQLHGVRNLAPMVLEPTPRFNVFVGDNGQGKTNLLESIYVLGALRSFRTQKLAELIGFGRDKALLEARIERGELERRYQVEIVPRARTARIDGKSVRPLARWFGGFNVVLFAPEDLAVPRGSPRERRRFLDRAVFHREPGFLEVARDHEKVLRSRNALLRAAEGRLPPRQVELLAVYDEQLARMGAALVRARLAFLDALRPRFAGAFEAITGTGLAADLAYRSEVEPGDGLEQRLAAGLAASRARDLARGTTSVGPHHDDLEFRLAGEAASAYASQGQLRALVLAWKTAEMDLLEAAHGDPPVLLLDDVSSELDPTRNAYLFEFLRKRPGQCFITTTHSRHVLLTTERVDFRVANGHVSLEEEK